MSLDALTGNSKFWLALGAIALSLAVFWGLKIRNIQNLKVGIAQFEAKLRNGQELWKRYPPLTPQERQVLQRSQEKLFRLLPRDKEVPPLFQELSRLARDRNLTNVSFHTGDGALPTAKPSVPAPGAPVAVVPQTKQPAAPKTAEAPGGIESFTVRVTFAGDYKDIAYFLEALRKIPRVMIIESLQLKRAAPLVSGEMLLRAYYYKGNLPAGAR